MGETPLAGWKEIAAFLNTSVRTVQRFERDLGLPIHRTHASKGAVVRAYPSELRIWLERDRQHLEQVTVPVADTGTVRTRGRSAMWATLILATVVLGAWGWRWLPQKRVPEDGLARRSMERIVEGGTEAASVRLSVQASEGSPIEITLRNGIEGQFSVAPDLDLAFRPLLRGPDLILAIGRRTSPTQPVRALTRVRLTLQRPAHVTIENVTVEIRWIGVGPAPRRP